MNLKSIFFFVIVIISSACDYVHEPKPYYDTITEIFLYNELDNTTELIINGYSPLLLEKTNRFIYQNAGLCVYNFSTNDSTKLLKPFFSTIDDYSVSPDEQYLIYCNKEYLKRLSLSNGSEEVLTKSDIQMYERSAPHYSLNGDQIIYLTTPHKIFENPDIDSVYINIFNFKTGSSFKFDTVFTTTDRRFSVNFSNDLKYIYLLKDGRDESHNRNLTITVFINEQKPKFISDRSFRSDGLYNNVWNIEDHKILQHYNGTIYDYDLSRNWRGKQYLIDSYNYSLKKTKYSNNVIGSNTDNDIAIMDLEGEIKKTVHPNLNAPISWFDYSQKNKYFLIHTQYSEIL